MVAAIAALAHLTYFALRFGSFYFPDSFTYLEPARQMLAGHGFVSGNPAEIETIRTPAYPLLLALFGAHTVPVIALQHLMSVAIAVTLFVFTFRSTNSRFAAWAASLMFALDTPSIHIANKLLTETAFTAVLFIVFCMRPRPIVTGLLTGVLVLLRPIAILFFVLVALRIPRRKLPVFVLAAVLLPLAWATRNWAHTGVFTVSSIANINMLTQRAAGVLAIEDGGNFRDDLLDEQQGLVEDANAFVEQKLNVEDAGDLPVAIRAREYGPYAMRVIAAHPVALIQLTIRGILINLFDSTWEAMIPVSRLHPSLLQYSLGFVPAVELVFAVIGLAVLWRADRALALSILLTVAYFLLMSAGAEAEARFRVPVVPEIAIAAAVGLEAVRRTRVTPAV